jgi:hypothetical protein
MPPRLRLVAVFAALVGVALGLGPATSPRGTGAPGPPGALAAQAVALSSTWSCAGATAGRGSLAAGRLFIANAGTSPLATSVRLVAQDGQARLLGLSVPPGRELQVPEILEGRANGEWVGALVDLFGGMGSVYQKVSTRWGSSVVPCAQAASQSWYFAGGSVLRNAALEISLINPYPVPAVADVSFVTNEGPEQPLASQGIVVPARGIAVLNVAALLRQRAAVATQVTTNSGQVAAFETLRVARPPRGAPWLGSPGALNPVLPAAGVAISGGVQPSRSWWWPAAGEPAGGTESYQVYNPSDVLARASLQLLPGGESVASSYSFTVAPASLVAVVTNGQPWALPGATYAAHIRSNEALVVERETLGPGVSLVPGVVAPWRRWVATPTPHAVYSPSGGEVAVYGRKTLELAADGLGKLTPAPGTAPVISSSSPVVVGGPAVPLS